MIAPVLDVVRRLATADDEPYLRELFADSRDDLALLPPEVRDQLIDMQFVAQRAQQLVTHPHASNEILVVEGRDVGRLILADCHVVDITVGRGYRRRGIATAVLGQVISQNLPQATTLQVWSANEAACALYAGLGFEPSNDEVGYLTMATRCAT
ncbi:MAG: hypothetical protein JWQ32_3139 [Marmoricola sp.]|nr:hypothetical protein [Marmoricola sp.]